jgi:dienelactone hydrolase
MVCGSDAYVEGEYIYQDYIYDDYGANTDDVDRLDNPEPSPTENNPMTGDLVYPTDSETYRQNAADLLEFRATTVPDGIKYRITLNTMVEPDTVGIAIGINKTGDTSTGTDHCGYNIGTLGPLGLDHILVAWGAGAKLDDEKLDPRNYKFDTKRNQIEITLPLDPEDQTWRHYLGVGLFDPENKAFKEIQNQPDESTPGGANDSNPPPFFNIGFRFDEPFGSPHPDAETAKKQINEAENSQGQGFIGHGNLRDHRQAKALESRDISEFYADINFGKLRSGTTEKRVPETGLINRLYVSRYDIGEGVDSSSDTLLNRIQPYTIYIPNDYNPSTKTPLSIHLHSLGSTYMEFAVRAPNIYRDLGEKRGAIVLTPEARGPSGSYTDEAELDVFEAWADAAEHYNIDFDQVTLSGYSMGGFGTFRLASLYPDLFAKVFTVAGTASDFYSGVSEDLLVNLRHLPVMMWNGSNDELVPLPAYLTTAQTLDDLGYRYELDIFTGFDHFTFGFLDEWGRAADFLNDSTVTRSPSRISYRIIPEYDNVELNLKHDKAYWVSDLEVEAGKEQGFVDIESKAQNEASPVRESYKSEGTDPAPHIKRGISWRSALNSPNIKNGLEMNLENIVSATIWLEDAGLDPTQPISLSVDSSSPVTLEFVCSSGVRIKQISAGQTNTTIECR